MGPCIEVAADQYTGVKEAWDSSGDRKAAGYNLRPDDSTPIHALLGLAVDDPATGHRVRRIVWWILGWRLNSLKIMENP